MFSPGDGDSWMFAKSVVQATDYEHGQIVEHLLKVRIIILINFIYYFEACSSGGHNVFVLVTSCLLSFCPYIEVLPHTRMLSYYVSLLSMNY